MVLNPLMSLCLLNFHFTISCLDHTAVPQPVLEYEQPANSVSLPHREQTQVGLLIVNLDIFLPCNWNLIWYSLEGWLLEPDMLFPRGLVIGT